MAQGFVYILDSINSSYIKIGGTERPIIERLRGINGTQAYAAHGPWRISDFLHVTDWRNVEGEMHRHFQTFNVRDAAGTRELFSIAPLDARLKLRAVSPELRVDHERTDAVFRNRDLKLYLCKLFEISGLFGNLDVQGAWTLTLMTSTNGGRWFTLNIGSHEVAFTTRRDREGKFLHHLVLDRLILDYPETVLWLGRHGGDVKDAQYVAAEHAVLISFEDDFARGERVFQLPGVRRALVAYWADTLADLRDRQAKSTFARFHSYDAVAELLDYKRSLDNPFEPSTLPLEALPT